MKRILRLITALCLSLASSGAMAQLCTASSASLSFGPYNPQSSANVDSTGTITVTCQAVLASLLITYNINLAPGFSGSIAQRKMSNGTSVMNYQVYSNAARTTIWGDGSSGSLAVQDAYLLQLIGPVSKVYNVYGRVPGNQNISAGAYTDTLTILITY